MRRGGGARAALAAALLATSAIASPSRAAGLEVLRPSAVAASARGEARGARGDGTRNGRSVTRLPRAPTVIWQRSLGGPIEAPPVVAADGRVAVVVGGADEVRVVGPDGEDRGGAPLGAAAAAAAPAFLADGTLVALDVQGDAVFIGPDLRAVGRLALGHRGADALPPVPTPSGGVLLLAGRLVVEADARGRVLSHVALPDVLSAPAAVARAPAGGHELIVTTPQGDLLAIQAPSGPRRLSAFGGPAPGGVSVADDGAVWAVSQGTLLRVSRRAGATPQRVSASLGIPVAIHAPALAPDGAAAVVASDGSLVVLEPSGEVRIRVAIDRPRASAVPLAAGRPPVAEDGPPVWIDADGTVAFVRPSGRAGVVARDGTVAIASERVCGAPQGLSPAGPGRFVVSCADGTLVVVGDAAPPPSSVPTD